MDEVKRVHWSEVSGPVFLWGVGDGFYCTLDDAADVYLDDTDPEDLDLDPECYLSIPLRAQVEIEEIAESLLSQVDSREVDVSLGDLVEWDELEGFVRAWNAKQQVSLYSEDLFRRVDWSGYPWEKHCGNHESWAPIRKKIAELRAKEIHDGRD